MQTPPPTAIRAWHFLPEDRRLRYGDGRLVEPGQTIETRDPPKLCWGGMHASRDLMDALRHAPGPVLCRVLVWGEVHEGSDKLTGRYRHVVWMLDATKALRLAAADSATMALEAALAAGRSVDPRSYAAVMHARDIANGTPRDQGIIDAAWSAACASARAAADAAARSLLRARVAEALRESRGAQCTQ